MPLYYISFKPIGSDAVTIENGKVKLSFPIPYATPSRYVEIIAENKETAKEYAQKMFEQSFSEIHEQENFNKKSFERGRLFKVDLRRVPTIKDLEKNRELINHCLRLRIKDEQLSSTLKDIQETQERMHALLEELLEQDDMPQLSFTLGYQQ